MDTSIIFYFILVLITQTFRWIFGRFLCLKKENGCRFKFPIVSVLPSALPITCPGLGSSPRLGSCLIVVCGEGLREGGGVERRMSAYPSSDGVEWEAESRGSTYHRCDGIEWGDSEQWERLPLTWWHRVCGGGGMLSLVQLDSVNDRRN